MKKPNDYKSLTTTELLKTARELLNFNCNQEVSDKEHNRHYNEEIKVLHDEIDRRHRNNIGKI